MYIEAKYSVLGENPYWVFISFLYAWIVADIAERLSHISSQWFDYKARGPEWWYVPVYSHLLVAAFVVGTSWLGWTEAFLNGDLAVLGEVLALSLLLIVDFWILATYFGFVATPNKARLSDPSAASEFPSSRLPAYWIVWIVTAYLGWDVLTYRVLPRWTRFGDGTHFWAHSWMTVFCLVLAVAAFWALKRVPASRPFWIVAGDLSLIALILFYRGLKQLASPSQGPIAQIENLAWKPFGTWLKGFTWSSFLGFIFLLSLVRFFAPQLMHIRSKRHALGS
jgi:hypothetical protein